jgi:osmotically-inducible protein OsmY
MINWNTFVPDDAVQVKVQKGWVTLTGKLEWQFQRTEAEDAVRRLAGVMGVTNNIELSPNVSVSDVKKRIEDALKRSAVVEAAGIKVNVLDNGKIKLEGKVHDWTERNAAERAAWSAPGVRMVEDRLTLV